MDADLRPGEVSAALTGLSGDDWFRLRRIARSHLHGTSLREQDLVNDAVCRALLGKRRCPRKVHVMAFLAQTMRSIATHERERCARIVEADVETRSEGAPSPIASPRAPSPEDALIEKETAAAAVTIDDMRDIMKDDAEAIRVLEGVDRGMKGRELRDFAGLSQSRFDYAKTRIRKAVLARHPQGRT